ncbi:GNAT family N-acetyltransferase [Bacillus sp. JJ1503]|uniref:GNAT family N-acetyltransferase n=1 Tax=unclassified Bacillus (in: firmicutes) TaxID=185979 RepID=UPI002FFF3B2D
MKILIVKLSEADFERLFTFEVENRAFFETMVPSRGDDYYEYNTFKLKNEALLEEQDLGVSHFYLIKGENGSILGRINLVDIDPVESVGSVGYRIGEAHTGKGIANHALKMLLEAAPELGVKCIKAMTATYNAASQKVLEKNGFIQRAASEEELNMNEENEFIYYIWSKEDSIVLAD